MILQPPKPEPLKRIEISSIGVMLDNKYCDRLDRICWENDLDAKVEFFINKKKLWNIYFVANITINGIETTISDTDINILKNKVKKELIKHIKIWYAVTSTGIEFSFSTKPKRRTIRSFGLWICNCESIMKQLSPGTIERITGVKMTWLDEPMAWVNIKEK